MTSRSLICIVLGLLAIRAVGQHAALPAAEPKPIQIGVSLEPSRVPAPLRRGVVLAAQSVSAVDVSDDGRFVAVGTMAGRHDRNFWLLSAATGEIAWGRYVGTW